MTPSLQTQSTQTPSQTISYYQDFASGTYEEAKEIKVEALKDFQGRHSRINLDILARC